MLLLHTIDADTSIAVVDAYAFLFGLGLGFNMQTLVLAIQNAVPPQDMGVATRRRRSSGRWAARSAPPIFLSVLFNGLPDKIAARSAAQRRRRQFQSAVRSAVRANPANKPVLEMLKRRAGRARARR